LNLALFTADLPAWLSSVERSREIGLFRRTVDPWLTFSGHEKMTYDSGSSKSSLLTAYLRLILYIKLLCTMN
jgi:hypothetical protein